MASLVPIIITITIPSVLLLHTAPCRAQVLDGKDAPVPEDFPKAFITAMAVAIVSVVLLLTLVCVLAHSWQHILCRHGRATSSGVPERWLDPVFEWPQQLRPLSRSSYRQRRKNRRRLRDRVRMRMGWGDKGVGVGVGVGQAVRPDLVVGGGVGVGGGSRNMGW
ncbi:hypothetical protein F4813DRAFT_389612 [Daldinia decipiens]|uniref:uncharacterized protein n=1 Tax=Daldinia decipiens TaxID=326647 RepID=UPI0020C29C8C|nr:uncharacterized protein F4813DRAFT_389612 [Daldinia decipiens]KAI1657436.1 hypothetical protein F4813DRAFT_389612 [Daldinia decipiens]